MPDNPPQSPKLLEQVRIRLRAKHYAYRTEKHMFIGSIALLDDTAPARTAPYSFDSTQCWRALHLVQTLREMFGSHLLGTPSQNLLHLHPIRRS
jgi:hypothetical protein